jgi:hypothetical protein
MAWLDLGCTAPALDLATGSASRLGTRRGHRLTDVATASRDLTWPPPRARFAQQASSADGAAIGKLASVVADLGLAAADRYTTTPDRLTKEAGLGAAFAATLFSTPPTPTPTPTPASSASPVSAYALEVRERVRDFVNEKVRHPTAAPHPLPSCC